MENEFRPICLKRAISVSRLHCATMINITKHFHNYELMNIWIFGSMDYNVCRATLKYLNN